MRALLAAGIIVVAFGSASVAAHRLDEYLQATRVLIGRDHVRVEIDLSPGVNVAPAIVRQIDGDGDGRLSGTEAEAYARVVTREVAVQVDGETRPLAIGQVEIAPIGDLTAGMGVIHIVATAPGSVAHAGRHEVRLRNDHRPEISVYLVNALMPETKEIAIGVPQRDERQREFRLDYEVKPAGSVRQWAMVAVFGLTALTMYRRPNRFPFLDRLRQPR